MTLRLYNTANKKKETFHPLQEGKVGIYVCGVTVYDLCHIGHARSAIVFDVLVRYLRAKGFDVTYVRNFTDVDDKIIERANKLGKDTSALAQEFIDAFYEDMDRVYVLKVNGSAVRPDSGRFFLFAGSAAAPGDLEPGDTIVVPEQISRIAWLRNSKDIFQILFQATMAAGVVIAAL